MNQEVQKRLMESLTASGSTDIIPYLPYLLQDFWNLGCDPEEMMALLREHTDFDKGYRVLDLACGKGAASICLAETFGCTAKGIDLLEDFISEAKGKAAEHGVENRCTFIVGDVNEAVAKERDYDLVIWGAAGALLGSYPETIAGIAATAKAGGYILFDDAYLPEEQQDLRYHCDYLTKSQWMKVFEDHNLTVAACMEAEQEVDPSAYEEDLSNIKKRANELIARFPEHREMFLEYVRSQQAEYEDLQDGCVGVLWLLQKKK